MILWFSFPLAQPRRGFFYQSERMNYKSMNITDQKPSP